MELWGLHIFLSTTVIWNQERKRPRVYGSSASIRAWAICLIGENPIHSLYLYKIFISPGERLSCILLHCNTTKPVKSFLVFPPPRTIKIFVSYVQWVDNNVLKMVHSQSPWVLITTWESRYWYYITHFTHVQGHPTSKGKSQFLRPETVPLPSIWSYHLGTNKGLVILFFLLFFFLDESFYDF